MIASNDVQFRTNGNMARKIAYESVEQKEPRENGVILSEKTVLVNNTF